MLQADALQLILDTAKKANAAQMLDIEGDGRTKHVRLGDEIKEIEIKPKPRDHEVLSLTAMIDYVTHRIGASSVIWHGDDEIVFLSDDHDRRDVVKMPLRFSNRYKLLVDLADTPVWHDQRTFVRMLRLDLGLDNISVVAKFRRLAWSDGSKTTGEFVHGTDKMGRQINAQIENAADIPDEIEIKIPVYDEFPDEMLAVKCAIEIDSRNQRLQLVPMPGELNLALVATQQVIHEWLLRELLEGTPIYYGTP